jgi:myosin heavy subunit
VTYNVDGFTEKNKDTLFSDLVETLQCSSNQFLVSLFPENTQSAQKKRPTTAGFKIKVRLFPLFLSSFLLVRNFFSPPHNHRLRLVN